MARGLIVNYESFPANDNATYFLEIFGNFGGGPTETSRQKTLGVSGVFSNLFTRVLTNTASVSSTITLRKSSADTAVLVTYASDETGVKEDTDSVSFSDTDEVGYEVTVPSEAGTNTLTLTLTAVVFTADSGTAVIVGSGGSFIVSQASTTRFINPGGAAGNLASETNAAVTMRGDYTISDLCMAVSANLRTTTTTFRTRINSGNGNQSMDYAGSETGLKTDPVNTDAITSGATFNFSFDSGTGTENLTGQGMSAIFTSSSSQFPMICQIDAGVGQAFNVTNNWGVSGNLNVPTTTESTAQMDPVFAFDVKNLTARVSANTITTSASTITFRDNGANGNQQLSYAAAETGIKVDTDTDSVAVGETINYQCITPNTSGTLTLRWISTTGEVDSFRRRVGRGFRR